MTADRLHHADEHVGGRELAVLGLAHVAEDRCDDLTGRVGLHQDVDPLMDALQRLEVHAARRHLPGGDPDGGLELGGDRVGFFGDRALGGGRFNGAWHGRCY
jgi:hypothetical protein